MIDLIASQSSPAGGAATSQIVIATAMAMVITAVMGIPLAGHVSGRGRLLARLAEGSSRVSHLPGWASLPSDLLSGSLLIALFGMYWDISLHIDNGRDAGPLANPAHYFILVGLFGLFFAGMVAIVLARHERTSSSIRLPNGWHAPVGGLVIALFGGLALLAFPLDDTWHRLFGQDVTLWGPTHLILIGAASFATLGLWILLTEGRRVAGELGSGRSALLAKVGDLTLPGALLIGLSTFQAEYDFGLPQFRLVLDPVLIMLAAGVALVAARVRSGPGGAFFTVGLYLVVRAAIAVLVGPVAGQSTTHFPLYLAEAGVVELVALRVDPRRAIRFGAIAGLGIGTVGLAAEWGWSHVWAPLEWPSSMLAETMLLAPLVAVAAGVIGGFAGGALRVRPEPRARRAVALPLAAAAAVVAVIAWGVQMPVPSDPPSASATLRPAAPIGGKRAANVELSLHPRDAAGGAALLNVHSWQGGGLVVARLRRTGRGRYETTRPVPVGGDWKTVVQMERDRAVLALPVYLPRDTAIPAPEVPASAHFTRGFVPGEKVFLREKKRGVPGGLLAAGYGVVGLVWLAMLGALGLALVRLAGRGSRPAPRAFRQPLHRTV
jgi:hypothetical protein